MEIEPIAHIKTDFPTKFGVPRQSGLVEGVEGVIVFAPKYRKAESLRGIEGWSHLWLIWGFSENVKGEWHPTVRPPRLGGNVRMGVFATRSPFRPNGLGLSAVKLLGVEETKTEGWVIRVCGADLVDGTPIYDIKPYLPLTDMRADALCGFAGEVADKALDVVVPEEWKKMLPIEKMEQLVELLRQDPRPAYQSDEDRVYGFPFAGVEVKFVVEEGVARVVSIEKMTKK